MLAFIGIFNIFCSEINRSMHSEKSNSNPILECFGHSVLLLSQTDMHRHFLMLPNIFLLDYIDLCNHDKIILPAFMIIYRNPKLLCGVRQRLHSSAGAASYPSCNRPLKPLGNTWVNSQSIWCLRLV